MNQLYLFLFIIFLNPCESVCQVSSYQLVQDMGRGLNLGNVLSAPIEGNWAPVVYEQYFIDVKNEGFSNVRIPVDFYGNRTSGSTNNFSTSAGTESNYNGSISDFTVDQNYLDRLQTIVDWSMGQSLYTVIDFHGAQLKSEFLTTFNSNEPNYTSPSSSKRAADLMKFKSIWTTIADQFINYPDHLIFEVVNEPYFELSVEEMNELNTMIITAIRSTGGNNSTRSIIITGGNLASYQSPTTISTEIIQSDEYLIASFHYYNPFNFTSSSSANSSNFNWGSESEKSIIMNHFNQVKTWSNLNNIPVTLGEFGADNANGINYSTGLNGDYGGPVNSDRVEYHRFIAEQAINRGFSFSAWCSGNKSNKTIHLRTDNPSTSNSISGVWVTDVKDALLESGNWPLCYGPNIDAVLLNPDFECGFSNEWIFSVLGSMAVANYSDATIDSFEGNVGGKVEVTSSDIYNKVLLSNHEYTADLTDKRIIIQGHVKALGPDQSIKIRIKSKIAGDITYSPSDIIVLSDGSLNGSTYQQVEFQYDVPEFTSSVQVQLMFGEDEGIYLIDNFSASIEEVSLDVDIFEVKSEILLFPNPSNNLVNISTGLNVHSIEIFTSLGKVIYQQINTNPIDIKQFSAGNYILKIETKHGESYYKKLLIK